jgi:hypothetical protein
MHDDMLFSTKVTEYEKNLMLNICDASLLGKELSQDNLRMNITKSYYGDKIVERKEAERLIQISSIINMVGKDTVSLSLELGIGSENGIKKISGIPFLIVFKM